MAIAMVWNNHQVAGSHGSKRSLYQHLTTGPVPIRSRVRSSSTSPTPPHTHATDPSGTGAAQCPRFRQLTTGPILNPVPGLSIAERAGPHLRAVDTGTNAASHCKIKNLVHNNLLCITGETQDLFVSHFCLILIHNSTRGFWKNYPLLVSVIAINREKR